MEILQKLFVRKNRYAVYGLLLASILSEAYVFNPIYRLDKILNPVEEERDIKPARRMPYRTEKETVEKHADRDLSFVKYTHYYDEGPVSEISACGSPEGQSIDYAVVKKRDGTKKEIVWSGSCLECHGPSGESLE